MRISTSSNPQSSSLFLSYVPEHCPSPVRELYPGHASFPTRLRVYWRPNWGICLHCLTPHCQYSHQHSSTPILPIPTTQLSPPTTTHQRHPNHLYSHHHNCYHPPPRHSPPLTSQPSHTTSSQSPPPLPPSPLHDYYPHWHQYTKQKQKHPTTTTPIITSTTSLSLPSLSPTITTATLPSLQSPTLINTTQRQQKHPLPPPPPTSTPTPTPEPVHHEWLVGWLHEWINKHKLISKGMKKRTTSECSWKKVSSNIGDLGHVMQIHFTFEQRLFNISSIFPTYTNLLPSSVTVQHVQEPHHGATSSKIALRGLSSFETELLKVCVLICEQKGSVWPAASQLLGQGDGALYNGLI